MVSDCKEKKFLGEKREKERERGVCVCVCVCWCVSERERERERKFPNKKVFKKLTDTFLSEIDKEKEDLLFNDD